MSQRRFKATGNLDTNSGRLVTESGTIVNAADLTERVSVAMTNFNEVLMAAVHPQIELQSAYGLGRNGNAIR